MALCCHILPGLVFVFYRVAIVSETGQMQINIEMAVSKSKDIRNLQSWLDRRWQPLDLEPGSKSQDAAYETRWH
jgi:hypothetical protein